MGLFKVELGKSGPAFSDLYVQLTTMNSSWHELTNCEGKTLQCEPI